MTVFTIYTFKEPAHLGRMIARLEGAQVVVHVDKKVAIEPFTGAIAPEDRERVHFLPNRVQVNWAGYSQLTAVRSMMREAVRIARPDEYIVQLSGQDYPIKPVAELERFLAAADGRQFMRYIRIEETPEQREYVRNVKWKHFRDLDLLSRQIHITPLRKVRTAIEKLLELMARALPPLPLYRRMPVAFGSGYWAATAGFIAELESRVTPEIDDYFRQIFCPEENFYQTLALNSPRGVETGGSEPGGAIPFEGANTYRYSNLHMITPVLEHVLVDEDWPLVSDTWKFFARKFSSVRSASLLDRIDRELLGVPPERSAAPVARGAGD